MKTYLAILRGINVGGHKKILMSDLKALFEDLKFKNVRTFIQSGNVIFESNSEKDLTKKIEKKITEQYGFEVAVIIRSAEEMKMIAEKNPFLKEKKVDSEKLLVIFLSDFPEKTLIENLKSPDTETDRFHIAGKEIFLHCPLGYGNSKLTNTFFEKKLKVNGSTRNWKTTIALCKMMQE